MRERKTMFANILHAATAIGRITHPIILSEPEPALAFEGWGGGRATNIPRGKGRVDSPRQRPNRVTISRRVRRKHRRSGR